jgi:AraC-like DNA-binding protein
VDIILNTGPAFTTENGTMLMERGQAYLVGTMTRYKEMVRPPETRLIGIRFRPGGFPFFYEHALLKNTADVTIPFDPLLIPVIPELSANPASLLDRFFCDRLKTPTHETLTLIASIHHAKGRLTVTELAKHNFTTTRQVERLFSLHLDISPKEFISVTRYRYALEKIRRERRHKTLLDIACECGYYDHAHLANDIRKYTGSIPTSL